MLELVWNEKKTKINERERIYAAESLRLSAHVCVCLFVCEARALSTCVWSSGKNKLGCMSSACPCILDCVCECVPMLLLLLLLPLLLLLLVWREWCVCSVFVVYKICDWFGFGWLTRAEF